VKNWKKELQESLNKREEEIDKKISKIEEKVEKVIGREISSSDMSRLRVLFAEWDMAEQQAIKIQDRLWDIL
jgi:hypothetical protein